MSDLLQGEGLLWQEATNMLADSDAQLRHPQGALVESKERDQDFVAVVYNKGDMPPEISIQSLCENVHTVIADGVAVAVVARADAPPPKVQDVLLVERAI